ncbi:unnamed protein product [Mytilus edulis]|uniref:Uncharacterized protein n=1 Tax=Mytilus edulis TaxID=6550 RepID=A0A8S3S1R3_MYTED|nr:unnamed protein product [Mytilus edulis]
MSSEDYHNLPEFMQESGCKCKDHKKKFELYCSLQVKCIADEHQKCQDLKPLSDIFEKIKYSIADEHQKCQDLKPLSDIFEKIKYSASVQLLEKNLKNLKENYDTGITYMNTRISTINTQETKAVEEIRYIKKSINDYLNKLEQDILNDLQSKYVNQNLDMVTVVHQMEQRASQINEMLKHFTKKTQYATELQMYIGLREIEKTTSVTAKDMEDFRSRDHVIENNLEVHISAALRSI